MPTHARCNLLGLSYPSIHQRCIRGCLSFYCRLAGKYHSLGSDGTLAVMRARDLFIATIRKRWLQALPSLFDPATQAAIISAIGDAKEILVGDETQPAEVIPSVASVLAEGPPCSDPTTQQQAETTPLVPNPCMADVFAETLPVIADMRAQRTVYQYQIACNDFLTFFGKKALWRDVTQARLRAWKDWLCQPRDRAPNGLGSAHVRKRAEMVRRLCEIYRQVRDGADLPDIEVIFNRYVDWSNPRNHTATRQRNRMSRGDIATALSLAEQERWPSWWHLLLFTAICTGVRKEGLSQLTWEEMHSGNKKLPGTIDHLRDGEDSSQGWCINIEEKGRNNHRNLRTIPIPRVLETALEAWWHNQGCPQSGSLWGMPLPRFGARGREQAMTKLYHRIGDVATRFFRASEGDLSTYFTLHDLRATTASLLTADGRPEAVVRAYLGHRQATGVTARYVSLTTDELVPHIHSWDPLGPDGSAEESS